MDPQEFLAGLSDEKITDLGYEGTNLLPIAVIAETFGIDLGVPPVDSLINGLQVIHNTMRDRGMIVEAHNLWDRLNESTEEPFFRGLTYEEMYPNEDTHLN